MHCIDSLAEAAPASYDAAILTCKAYDTAALAAQVAHLVANDGVVGSLQNGLGNAQKILRFVPPDQAAVALTSNGITVEAPGRLLHAGSGPTLVGPALPGHTAGARHLEQLLADADLAPSWHDDMRGPIWAKAIVNAGINPTGALHGARNGQILTNPNLLEDARTLVAEALEIAHAAAVKLPDTDFRAAMETTLALTAGNKCSMLQDMENRRPTEIDQITGRLLAVATKFATPATQTTIVYRKIKALEQEYLGQTLVAHMADAERRYASDPY